MPDYVTQHYLFLYVDQLNKVALRHYRILDWPKAEALRNSQKGALRPGLILEGSALWPEFATVLNFGHIAALWLTADSGVSRQRM